MKAVASFKEILLAVFWGSLWHRYTMLKLIRMTLVTLLGLFIFYVSLDASINSAYVMNLGSAVAIAKHYALHFLKRLPQLLPFALTLTSAHLLIRMQRQNESLSLLMGGVSRLNLLFAFLKVALLGAVIVFATSDGWFFPPTSLKKSSISPASWLTLGILSKESDQFEAIPLDHELNHWLVYRRFNTPSKTFSDVFWIQSEKNWWHFETLVLKNHKKKTAVSEAKGFEADRFDVNSSNERIWSQHHQEIDLEIPLNIGQLTQEARGAQELSTLELWKALEGNFPKIQRPKLRAYLYYRLLQPLLCLLAPLFPAALTLSHQRASSNFWIYLISLFSLITLFMIGQSGLLLSASARMHPLWSLALPYFAAFLGTSYFIRRL